MKNNKTNILFFFFLFAISLSCFASAQTTIQLNSTSTSDTVQLTSLKYNPYPVVPGEYFDFWVSAQYVGNSGPNGLIFQLVPSYPFSLDPGDNGVRNFGAASSPSLLLHYKIRVDSDAVAGTNTLSLNYNIGNLVYTQSFDVDVENPKTNFDAVIQSVSGTAVSIAIANTGENTANAVIVKIPDQDNFVATGTTGQMVGNLNSGDYTVVSFTISPKMTVTAPSQNSTAGSSKNSNFPSSSTARVYQSSTKPLTFEIDYTDTIGERRIMNMSLPLTSSSGNSSSTSENFRGRTQTTSLFSEWYFWAIIAVVLATAGFIIYKKISKAKKMISGLSKKNKKKDEKKSSDELPDWIKNLKEKEKK